MPSSSITNYVLNNFQWVIPVYYQTQHSKHVKLHQNRRHRIIVVTFIIWLSAPLLRDIPLQKSFCIGSHILIFRLESKGDLVSAGFSLRSPRIVELVFFPTELTEPANSLVRVANKERIIVIWMTQFPNSRKTTAKSEFELSNVSCGGLLRSYYTVRVIKSQTEAHWPFNLLLIIPSNLQSDNRINKDLIPPLTITNILKNDYWKRHPSHIRITWLEPRLSTWFTIWYSCWGVSLTI